MSNTRHLSLVEPPEQVDPEDQKALARWENEAPLHPAIEVPSLPAPVLVPHAFVNGRKLAENIRDMYNRHIVFHSDLAEAEAGAMTLWTFHTYVWVLADFAGYVLITAPTSEAGKSRVFDVARLLVFNPFVVVDPSPAGTFRTIDELRPTFFIDEADMLRESRALRVVLNSGFQPGTPVHRANGTFQTFCPKIFSGISGLEPPLTEATLSRCIQIPIRRKSPDEHVAKFSARHVAPEARLLKDELVIWARENAAALKDAEPVMPHGLTDRQQDAWAQLFAIADLIGWGGKAREWAVTLFKAIPKPADPAVQILHDVKRILDAWEGNRIPSAVLADKRNNLEGRDFEEDLTGQQLGRRLAGFGINADPSAFRVGGVAMRGFTFRRAGKYLHKWDDAFRRYGLMT